MAELQPDDIRQLAATALDEARAQDIRELDIRNLTDIADWMIVASGTSSRHVLALSEAVREVTRGVGLRPLGTEGESESDWVLLDYGDVIVQLMLPTTRAFYDLEGLWNDRLGEKLKNAREGQTDL